MNEPRLEPLATSRPLLVLLVLATLMANLVVFELSVGRAYPDYVWLLFVSLAFSQVSMLGIWAALGTAHGMLRLASLCGSVGIWAWAISSMEGDRLGQWITVLAMQAACVLLPCLVARMTGWMWTASSRSHAPLSSAERRRPQFSVSQLLAWMTVVAIVVVIGRESGKSLQGVFIERLLLLPNNAAVAISAAWVASATRRQIPLAAAQLMLCGLLGTLLDDFFSATAAVLWINILQSVLVWGWIRACRIAGYSIVHDGRPNESSCRSTTPRC